MKRIFLSVSLVMMFTQAAWATLITFDDITMQQTIYTGGQVPQGYGGFGWMNFYINPHGGDQSVVSYDESGITAATSVFTLNGAELTGSAFDQRTVEVVGLGLGTVLYDRTYVLSTEPAWYEFDYVGINTVLFRAPGWEGLGLGPEVSFGMDNLRVNEPMIPEPGTTLAGLLALLPFAITGIRKLKGKFIGRGCHHG